MRRTDRELRDIAELRGILERGDTCRIALVDDGEPYIVALNYGYEWAEGADPVLYFHCARQGRKLDIIARKPDACCIVDTDHRLVTGEQACQWGMNYASLVGWGKMEVVRELPEKKRGLDALMVHYSGSPGVAYDERVFAATEVLRLRLDTYTGKRRS